MYIAGQEWSARLCVFDTDKDMLGLDGEVEGKSDCCNVFLNSQNSIS